MRTSCNHHSVWSPLVSVRWPLLVALLLAALTAGGCVTQPLVADEAIVAELTDRTVPVIAIAPIAGAPGTTLFVSGAGWRADEVVYVNLEGEREADRVEGTVAIATADGEGRFTVAFVFPMDEFWSQAVNIAVVAYSLETGERASAPFELTPLAETPTSTVTPTATSTPAPEGSRPSPRPPADQARVTSAGLNLRTGPSTLYPVVRALRHGAVLTVLGQNSTGYWLYVQTLDGALGWVARPFTDFRGTAPEVSAPPLPPGGQSTPTATPTFTAWRGQYFANISLSGAPVLTRNDMAVKFDWGYGSPGPNVPKDNFSARWTRTLVFPEGTHRFFVASDDGVRLWVDGRLIIDEWHDATGLTYAAELYLPAGPHELKVEYYERTQLANISVWWQPVSGFPEWRGEYFANQTLAGNPQRVRNDGAIDFDWGYGSPAPDIPADGFSVRWLRSLHFDAGTYRFRISTDDGMRLFVDDRLIIDEWSNGSVRERTADLWLDAGVHSLRVEYYENTAVAVAKVSWARIETPSQSFPDWKGEYFSNRHLDGSPTHRRNDDEIDFNWGTSRPAPGVPSTNFSVRWTREVDFSAGTYRFYARADDGIRAYVGGDRIIDEWQDSRGEVVYTADRYLDGDEDMRVEYYQREGGALAEFWWERLSSTSTPTHTPTPTRTPTATPVTRTPTPTATRAPYADVNPSSGPAGTAVTVSCGGFPPNTPVSLYLGAYVATARAAASAQPIATGATDRFGACSFRTTVPDAWPDGRPVEPGRLSYLVATANFAVSAAARFDLVLPRPTESLTPYLDVNPSSGGAGTQVDAQGGGFPANATVNLFVGEIVRAAAAGSAPSPIATVKADARGNFATSFAMPSRWPDGSAIDSGKLVILAATGDFAVEASATFDYFVEAPNPSISLQPKSGGTGTSVTVSGGGFPANTSVAVYLATLDAQVDDGGAQRFATGSTDRNGRVSLTFRMPDAWPNGAPVLDEELVVTVATADFSVAASAVFDYAPSAPTPTPTITATPTHTPTPTTTPVDSPTPTPNPYARLSPRSGGEGTAVTVSGGGFPANATLYVHLARFDGGSEGGAYERYATTSTDAAGDYAAAFTMPGAWPDGTPITTGRIAVLVATEDFSAQASATFSYSGVTAAGVEPAQPVAATPTPTPTATNTPDIPADASIDTREPPAATRPDISESSTATPTDTPEPPTAAPTNTPEPPTAMPTDTPVPPAATPTHTPQPPTATPTVTPVQPAATSADTAPPADASDLPTWTPFPEPEQGSEAS